MSSELEVLQDRLAQMVLSAECAINVCKLIAERLVAEEAALATTQEVTYFYNNPYISTLAFTSNLYFHEALLVASSILERGGLSKEASIARYLQISNTGSAALQRLIEEFDQEHLREIRNTRVAHKDAKTDSGGHQLFFTTYSLEYINKLSTVITKINTTLRNDIGIPVYANNYLCERIGPGVNEMIEHLVQKYNDTKNSTSEESP